MQPDVKRQQRCIRDDIELHEDKEVELQPFRPSRPGPVQTAALQYKPSNKMCELRQSSDSWHVRMVSEDSRSKLS